MLRVLHVLIRMPGSGTERQLAGTLRAAHRVRWHATLCVLRPGYPLAAELAADGIPVLEPDAGSDAARLRALRRLVGSGRFDVVHSSLWGGNVAARLAAAVPGRPAVVVSERRVEDFRSRRARLIDRSLRPLADAYIGNSEDVAAFIRRAHGVGADRVTVVRNGLDAGTFRPLAARPREGGPARIGALGRLVPQKGFDVALAALPRIVAATPARLTIAGEGPLRAQLEARAAGLPVTFAGFLPTPAEVASFLGGIDVLVAPSRYEGLSNVVLEARACGVPVVASDVAGMAEAADDGVTLVPADDPAALARAVLRVLDAPPPRGNAGRSFADVAAEHLDVFLRAVERRERTSPALAGVHGGS